MLNHYKVTDALTHQFASPMPLRRVAQGILAAPLRFAANAGTRLSNALASWVALCRFLIRLDRHAPAFYGYDEGRADPNSRTKNGGSMSNGAATTDRNARPST